MCSVKKIINKHLPYEPVLIICIMIIQPEEARLCCGTNDPNVSMAYSYKDLLSPPLHVHCKATGAVVHAVFFSSPRLTEVISFWNTVSLTAAGKEK